MVNTTKSFDVLSTLDVDSDFMAQEASVSKVDFQKLVL